MAASYMASMLDELMGRNRDQPPGEKGTEKTWDDQQVCKHYLCGFCPNELFINTRADLGPCDKIHDEQYKKEYETSGRFERMGYEEDFLRFLQSLLSDVERRIRRGHQRLALSTQTGGGASNLATQKEEKVDMLTQRINELVEQAEELGCEGKVEESQGVMKLCEQLKEEREQLETRVEQHTVPSMKDMEVCDVCGAFLILGDAQQRLEEHLMGKQHMGFAKVRVTVENIKAKMRNRDAEREARLVKEREDREKEREREREERQKQREEREKERAKERERTRKRRSRSRSRGRRSRSRSHGREGKSRDRDRDRERDRDRDRERDRRRRSRSREHRRSRSRDRHRRSRSRSRGHRSSRPKRSRSKDRHSHRSDSRERRRDRDKESKDRDSKHKDKSEEPKPMDEASHNGEPKHSEVSRGSSQSPEKRHMDTDNGQEERAAGLSQGDSN